MSLTASYVIIFVMIARLLLKKAPKVISYALWSVVAFRLLCPFSFESLISLIPARSAAIPQNIVFQQSSQMSNRVSAAVPYETGLPSSPSPAASTNFSPNYQQIGAYLWIIGIAAMLIYSIVSIQILKRRLKGARDTEKNIFVADNLRTPFVLGIFKPRIYIPSGLTAEERTYIIRHEQTHIRRFDHIIKPFAFLVLSIHWFNPLVWIAFLLMGTDMELSCDEQVIKQMGSGIKKAYSKSLLSLATGKHILNGVPLAFGEGNIRSRVKNVLKYKKPAFWVIVVAIVSAVCVGIGLAANPKGPVSNPAQTNNSKIQKQPTSLSNFVIADNGTTLSNGRKVSVRLVMTDGKYYSQSQVPYGGNTYENNYQGSYELQVWDSSKKLLSKSEFNTTWYSTDPSKDTNFPGKFDLLFDDYNHDGNPDFVIGQWFTSSAKQYQIFTVTPDGSVKEISRDTNVVQDCDFTDVKNSSVKFEKDNENGFYTTKYFNGNVNGNRWQKIHYVWDADKSEFAEEGSSRIPDKTSSKKPQPSSGIKYSDIK